MGLPVDWIKFKPYEIVKYRKRVENWCYNVLKYTTPYGGTRTEWVNISTTNYVCR